MEKIAIITEYIKLGQFLKLANIILNGAEAKMFLEDNIVYVNKKEERRRGRKLYVGDEVEINSSKYVIVDDK